MREKLYPPRTPEVWRARATCRSCGACCRATEMILTLSDVRRLEALGYRREEFAVKKGDHYVLRNVSGVCYFYDERSKMCRVYDYRPIGCSLYPIVIDARTGELLLDSFCPISRETTVDELKKARRYAKLILAELRWREGSDNREC
ncbi:MAG: YkgJ family cysteine cluster protein [Thermoprotei archaeon]|nr:MAG: YkgJ family cysteine cluster protein [Thermoprotei archaeon]